MLRKIILFFLVFNLANVYAINNRQKRISQKIFKRTHLLKSQEDFSFKQCEEFNHEKSFYLKCQNGEIHPVSKIQDVQSKSQLISVELYKNYQLIDFKQFVLKQLQQKYLEFESLFQCFHEKSLCNNVALKLRDDIKKKIPLLREYMAFKDRPLAIGAFSIEEVTPYRKKPTHDLGFALSLKVPRVTGKEDERFREIYDKKIQDYKKEWEEEQSEEVLNCLSVDDKKCFSNISQRAVESSKRFEGEGREDYSKKYLNLLSENPLLLYIHLDSDASDERYYVALKEAVDKVRSSIASSIEKIEQMDEDDLYSLVSYKAFAESYLSQHPNKELGCRVFQKFVDESESDEILADIGIGAAVVGAGFICGASGGMLCAFGAFVGAEAIGLAYLEGQIQNRIVEFNSGLVDARTVKELISEERTTVLLAPTGILPVSEAVELGKNAKFLEPVSEKLSNVATVLKNKFSEVEFHKASEFITAAEQRDLNIELPSNSDLEFKQNARISRGESDYRFFMNMRQGKTPPPQTKLDGYDFYDPKPAVDGNGYSSYDPSINFFRSAESKNLETQ